MIVKLKTVFFQNNIFIKKKEVKHRKMKIKLNLQIRIAFSLNFLSVKIFI